MKEAYPDEIMLCFVQGFGDTGDNCKALELHEPIIEESNSKPSKRSHRKQLSLQLAADELAHTVSPLPLVTGKSLRLSSGEKLSRGLPEVKRSFSDRFSVIRDGNGKRQTRGLLTIRKTWSTGNFPSGAGGGSGAPRSAPATPLLLEPHPRTKHDKHAVKPLSGSAPSVRAAAIGAGDSDGKPPSKSRQKKFIRHFPQVGPEEKVLNYYSCALVGDLLLQGHMYITRNYFAFYSNVFGYVTKLLIPTTSVVRITKEKVARIIPNAVGVCTRDERHVFGSLLSRDAAYALMTRVWKAAKADVAPKPQEELRASELELDASEYSPEDDSSSGHERAPPPTAVAEQHNILPTGSAVIQPVLLTGSLVPRRARDLTRVLLLCCALLAMSAAALAAALYTTHQQEEDPLSGSELYLALVRARARLHGRAATELHAFLSTNLLLLSKVRQSLESLSGVILTDMAQTAQDNVDVPNETVFS